MTNFGFYCWCCFPNYCFLKFRILKQWFCDFQAVPIWLWKIGYLGVGLLWMKRRWHAFTDVAHTNINRAQDSPCKGIGVWLFFKIPFNSNKLFWVGSILAFNIDLLHCFHILTNSWQNVPDKRTKQNQTKPDCYNYWHVFTLCPLAVFLMYYFLSSNS